MLPRGRHGTWLGSKTSSIPPTRPVESAASRAYVPAAAFSVRRRRKVRPHGGGVFLANEFDGPGGGGVLGLYNISSKEKHGRGPSRAWVLPPLHHDTHALTRPLPSRTPACGAGSLVCVSQRAASRARRAPAPPRPRPPGGGDEERCRFEDGGGVLRVAGCGAWGRAANRRGVRRAPFLERGSQPVRRVEHRAGPDSDERKPLLRSSLWLPPAKGTRGF